MLVGHAAVAQSRSPVAGGFDRPTGDPKQSRSVVLAQQGLVATSHPLAAQVGLDILKAGGNAADAAIAANAMLGAVEPMSCGIGGDLFLIYWDAKTKRLYGLNASGRSPYTLRREVFAARALDEIPTTGPLSWSVPGCVSGWDELRKKFGTRSWEQLLGPAAQVAREGFPVPEVIAAAWQGSTASLRRWPTSARTFLSADLQQAPRFGDIVRNPDLAWSYEQIMAHGAAAFYHGEIAARIVTFSEQNGGFLTRRDLADHRSDWIDPVSTNYRGYDVWELPPNGQGIAALQMLNLLEPYDLRALGPGHPDLLHLIVEAKKLAFADRARYYFDPAFGTPPVSQLISKEYARHRATLLDRNRAAEAVSPAEERQLQELAKKTEHGDTIYLTVVDRDRNCCSLIQSIYHGFGSQVVPGEVGFALQNRGALFALDEHHPNRLEPHKRPFHTIIPAFVTRQGKPWLCFGVMGGDMQPQGHVQVLINLIDFGLNVQAAGDAARIQHLGSATPTGQPGHGSGTVQVESGIPDESVAALRAKGHTVFRAKGSFGGYQAILIDPDTGVLHGATEARKDGAAVGY
jgi:gamma-glutamyltranspeptidase/glutathione hydrolase